MLNRNFDMRGQTRDAGIRNEKLVTYGIVRAPRLIENTVTSRMLD